MKNLVLVVLITICFCFCANISCAIDSGIFMPPFDDIKDDINRVIDAEMTKKGIIPSSSVFDTIVERIRKKFTEVWKTCIVKDKIVNGLSSPNYIYLNSGLILLADPGEIAGAILHEVGHIFNKDCKKKYELISKSYNTMAPGLSKTGSEENLKLAQKIIPMVVGRYTRDMEFEADFFAWSHMPDFGYSSDVYTNFLLKLGGDKKSNWVEKAFSDHPPLSERVEKLRSYGPSKAPVGDPADVTIIEFSSRYQDIDPTSFVPAFKDEKVAGYTYLRIKDSCVIFFNREGEVNKKKPGFFDTMLKPGEPRLEKIYINDGEKKATEMVIVLKNFTTNHLNLIVNIDDKEYGIAGHPDNPKQWKSGKSVEVKHGDWPRKEYVALKCSLDGLIGTEHQLMIIAQIFNSKGDEAYSWSTNDVTYCRNLFLIK